MAEYGPDDLGLPLSLTAALERLGIPRLYSHQAKALDAHPGRQKPPGGHAHGQRQDPDLQSAGAGGLLRDDGGHALYLFPLKALEQDQLKALKELDAALPSPFLRAAIYDGDTPPASARPSRPSRPTC